MQNNFIYFNKKNQYVELVTLLVFFVFMVINYQSIAQNKLKIKSEHGDYSMKLESNLSTSEAERICIERAKIDAIEKAFGKVIYQGNSTYINNSNDLKVETTNVFNFISDTYVNGEWIEDINAPIISKEIFNSEIWIKVKVYGKIRELNQAPTSFQAFSLACPELKCKTINFNDGQDFYLYFKTPVKGYVTIYVDFPSESKTYRVLPYRKYSEESNLKVNADSDYIFFSKKFHDQDADELVLSLSENHTSEMIKLFVLFSPNFVFDKPILNSNSQLNDGFVFPQSLPSEEFQKWIQNLRSRNSEIQLFTEYISIKK